MAEKCIIITGFGYTTHKSFVEWVRDDIQDNDAAIAVAESMLLDHHMEYAWNENSPPSYYQEFLISDKDEFKRQLEELLDEFKNA